MSRTEGTPRRGHEHGRQRGDEQQLDDARLGQRHVAADPHPAPPGCREGPRETARTSAPSLRRRTATGQCGRPCRGHAPGGAPEGASARRYDDHPVQLPGVTPRAFLRITQVTVVLVVLNIVTGAAVRLTDSGLGCPDWPTCSRTT